MAKTVYRTVAEFPSKSKPGKYYTVKIDDLGQLSCNCPAWVFKKGGARTCPHVLEVRESMSNPNLRPEDKAIIRKEVSNAIKAGRTVPFSLQSLIESGISLDRIRKVYRKENPLVSLVTFHDKTDLEEAAKKLEQAKISFIIKRGFNYWYLAGKPGDIKRVDKVLYGMKNPYPRWKIIGRHKWVSGATITESYREDDDSIRRFTATIRRWQNWRIFEGKLTYNTTKEVIAKVKDIRDRIDRGDEAVFHNPDYPVATKELKCEHCSRSIYPGVHYIIVRTHKLGAWVALKYHVKCFKESEQNPLSDDGSKLYKSFHGASPIRKRKVFYQEPEGEIIKIGRLARIEYNPEPPSKLTGTRYTHESGDLGHKVIKSNAILASNKEGTQLYIVKEKNTKFPRFSKFGILG